MQVNKDPTDVTVSLKEYEEVSVIAEGCTKDLVGYTGCATIECQNISPARR
jgi:hypothetical protein